jgi:hypothetical protein
VRLAELARNEQRPAPAAEEACDLCGAVIAPGHRHLVDLDAQRLLCACRACVLLFDRGGAGGGHFRLVPERRLALGGFRLDDARWAGLSIPVELAFFFRSTAAGRVVAFYPSPLGATESLLDLTEWDAIEADNPVLRELEPDVEALLVRGTADGRECYLVPIDECYALVGLIRMHWRGLAGGERVWAEVEQFFDRLREEAAWRT